MSGREPDLWAATARFDEVHVGGTPLSALTGRADRDTDALFDLVADEHERAYGWREAHATVCEMRHEYVMDRIRQNDRRVARGESSSEFQSGQIARLVDRVDVLMVGTVGALVGGLSGVAALVGSIAGWW